MDGPEHGEEVEQQRCDPAHRAGEAGGLATRRSAVVTPPAARWSRPRVGRVRQETSERSVLRRFIRDRIRVVKNPRRVNLT